MKKKEEDLNLQLLYQKHIQFNHRRFVLLLKFVIQMFTLR